MKPLPRSTLNFELCFSAGGGADGARERAGAGADQAAVRPAHQGADRGARPAQAARQCQQDQDRQVQIQTREQIQ